MAVASVTEQPGSKHNVQAARQAYYDKISKFHMAPLWEVLKDLVTKEPKRFESLPTGDGAVVPLVVPKPIWGWTILDAIRARLDLDPEGKESP